ncbi:hypothetical protein MPLDJ20_140061 [Mesorhizobium plurifarium]|uniref:Uncharacterized protein n=1 Tax=Mesorhizobium plurifarium TaxID=69974 RepID=A0A090GH19_MESPL|nr:hypothetical protein MPLDJ20_140061 [Mesorhizobium plurifarium]
MRHLRQFQRKHHALPRCHGGRRRQRVAAGQELKPAPCIGGGSELREALRRWRREVQRIESPQHALPDLLLRLRRIHLGRRFQSLREQRLAYSLDPHPRLRIVLHHVPMLGEPQSGRGGDLRGGGRGAVAVHVDHLAAVDFRPGHVRRVGAERRVHLGRRPVIALHGAESKAGIGASVAHHAAGRKHPVVARRIDDAAWREGEIVTRRGDHHQAVVVGKVDGVDQGLRGEAAHAHRQHLRALLARIVDALHHGARGQPHHPVGDANRQDFRQWRAADEIGEARPMRRSAVELVAGKQAERAGAMAAIAGERAGWSVVGRVVRTGSVVDEVALLGCKKPGRQGLVVRVETGIEMGDRDVGLLGAHPVARRRELAEVRRGVPGDAPRDHRLSALRILIVESADGTGACRHAAVAGAAPVIPLLRDIGLDREHLCARGGKRRSSGDKIVDVVPGIVRIDGIRCQPQPGGAAIPGRSRTCATDTGRESKDRFGFDPANPGRPALRREPRAVAMNLDKESLHGGHGMPLPKPTMAPTVRSGQAKVPAMLRLSSLPTRQSCGLSSKAKPTET